MATVFPEDEENEYLKSEASNPSMPNSPGLPDRPESWKLKHWTIEQMEKGSDLSKCSHCREECFAGCDVRVCVGFFYGDLCSPCARAFLKSLTATINSLTKKG